MNLKFYLEKLHSSETFKKFLEENPEAFPCSGFFVIDKEGNDNKQHIDYYVPNTNKIFSFQLEEKIKQVPIDILDNRIPEKIFIDYDFDFKKIEQMIINEMIYKGIKNKLQKILLSLQNSEGKDVLVGTIFISGLGMLKVRIDISEMKITEFEKKSFLDILKKR